MNLVEVNHVSKRFEKGEYATSLRDTLASLFSRPSEQETQKKTFWALQDISFTLKQGDVLALIGSNGSGKSTLLKLIARVLKPNKGSISSTGRLSALIELVAGLHPDLTGIENIYLSGSILGMSRKEITERLDQIIEFAGLREFIDTPLKRYSSGMHMRLGFSVAIHVDPDILLLDEILAVGDADFQKKCFAKVKDLTKGTKGIILVTHNMAIVSAICTRAIVLDKGRFIAEGSPSEMIAKYEQVLAQKANLAKTSLAPNQADAEKVQITYCIFKNSLNQETRTFSMNDTVTITIHGVSMTNLDHVAFVVCADRYDGLRCFLKNSIHQQKIDLKAGPFSMDLQFEKMTLLPGTYDFKFAIVDEDYLVDHAMRFGEFITIESKTMFDDRYGIFQPEAKWCFKQE